ncbi:MAG TPA: xanthine dehydrogenase family protein molybdopterin-binding subunit [Solirubrobacteraceae bacterium]|jgi:xanthine dehydrogenase YagR molybdenum-binding subunit|nr:xanthine dehydrogenase family protein molybdopterin-binding subunit [Solirubrobacteraceae bacterium]
MATALRTPAIGGSLSRVDGRLKVTGQALYAAEHQIPGVAHAALVGSAIAAGAVIGVDATAALALPGVLAVISYENAPRLARVDDAELAVLQSPAVAYRGQLVAAVVAESLETAREAAELVRIEYDARGHDVALRPDHPRIYQPEKVNPAYPADTALGDADAALAGADAIVVDETYETPAVHNNPLEPHASLAVWTGGDLTVYESTQGAAGTRDALAELFELEPRAVRVVSPHVGGGFGSKGKARPQIVVAAVAARVVGRPVKLALTRREMFALTGYRTPTIQRVRLAADHQGVLLAIVHDVLEQTSTLTEFAEQTATATRMMYAAPNRRTSHRLLALDVPTPSWMRAPGECPGMYALESALDELAVACRIDPIDLRIRNEPEFEPESGKEWSSRNLVACLRQGAARFGWADRDPTPAVRRDGSWLIGTGVASSTYPTYRSGSRAAVEAAVDGRFTVSVCGADIGTGARTVLTQIAADALDVPTDLIDVELGDSALPRGPVAGGSMGTGSWGGAVVRACEALVDKLAELRGIVPPDGVEAIADTAEEVAGLPKLARHAFGAQFAEVRVNPATGEVRVPRLLGMFAAGRIINPKTARSQFIGGMTMGLSMALFEQSLLDLEFGDYLNHDFAQYHVPSCADVIDIDAAWIDEHDDQLNPMGSKGIGEIGIVGTAAAIANAVHHATGLRVRRLPITPDRLIV